MKRLLVLMTVLALLLPLSLFAQAAKEVTTAAELGPDGRFTTTRKITVEVFDRGVDDGRTPAEKNVWTDWMKAEVLKKYNIDVTFVPVPRWTETDAINNLLAAGDAPDVCYTYSYPTVQQYAAMGGVTDLAPYVEQYKHLLPNMFDLLEDINVYNNLDPQTGTLWALEARQFYPHRNSVFVREDWLKKLGMAAPTNHAEFEAMLKAFKDNAQLLLGADASKMIPMSISVDIGWMGDPLTTSFVPEGLSDELLWALGYDDRRIMWPGYKDGIRLLNKWYNLGYIWKDFPLYPFGDQTYHDNLVRSGFVGAFMHNWDYPYRAGGIDIQTTLAQTGGSFIAVDPFPNDAGLYRKYLPSTTGDRKIFFPNTNKEPLASLLYLEWLSTLENRKYLQIGPLGVTHKVLDSGAIQIIPAAVPEWIQNSADNIDYTMVINGKDLGSAQLNGLSLGLGYSGVDPKYLEESYRIEQHDGRIVKNYTVGTLEAQVGLDNVLRDKRNDFLVRAVVAPTAQFDAVYDAGWSDYLATGGRAIIRERLARYEEIYGVKIQLPAGYVL